MKVYEITLVKNAEDAFAGMRVEHEFIDWNEEGEEVYSIATDKNIDRQLDLNPQVKKYTVR